MGGRSGGQKGGGKVSIRPRGTIGRGGRRRNGRGSRTSKTNRTTILVDSAFAMEEIHPSDNVAICWGCDVADNISFDLIELWNDWQHHPGCGKMCVPSKWYHYGFLLYLNSIF